MKKLNDQTVLITGGSSGIGLACAMAAAAEGANIAILDMASGTSDAAMEEIRNKNSRALFIPCDVSDFEQVKAAIELVVGTFGSLDIALNNAGIGGTPGKIGDMTEETWLKVTGVNLNGVFFCMKHELQQMAKQKSGVIVNMSSILGKVGFSNASHYVAAKHGVLGLTKTAALEYAEEGIRVVAICPGFIDTPLLAKGGISENPEILQHIVDLHPVKRLGKSEEIASAFVFLASKEASFMTGTSVEVDGGFLAQ